MPKHTKRKRSDLLNQSQAAELIGVSRPTIPAMIARGDLKGEVHGGFLLVPRASAEQARDARAAAVAAKQRQTASASAA